MFDASIKRGVTGDILVNESTMLYVTDVLISFVQIVTPRWDYFKHAWVISLNKASHHIKIKCEFIYVCWQTNCEWCGLHRPRSSCLLVYFVSFCVGCWLLKNKRQQRRNEINREFWITKYEEDFRSKISIQLKYTKELVASLSSCLLSRAPSLDRSLNRSQREKRKERKRKRMKTRRRKKTKQTQNWILSDSNTSERVKEEIERKMGNTDWKMKQ